MSPGFRIGNSEQIFGSTSLQSINELLHPKHSHTHINTTHRIINNTREELEDKVDELQEFNLELASIPQDRISITYLHIINLQDGKLTTSTVSREVRVKNKYEGIGFTSLSEAIKTFNQSLVDNNVTHIGLLQIVMGPGQTWVVSGDKRTLIGPGCAYSNDVYTLDIGRSETMIQAVRIVGSGQGASTCRGSCVLNVWNLQNMGVMVVGDNEGSIPMSVGTGSSQFDLRLLMQNFFWVGWLAVNLKYSEPVPGMITPDVSGFDIFNHTKNRYIDDSTVGDYSPLDVIKWRQNKGVEILMMNVWIQLSNPPLGVTSSTGEFIPMIQNFKLMMPVFYLNAPSMFRLFVSNCNWISYDTPVAPSPDSEIYGGKNMPPALVEMNAQFLNTKGVTDSFFQMCSFSCREFAAPFPDFRSIQLWGHAKVSMANCQFSGRCSMECNKIAAFGCYFLGTGIYPHEDNTTHALVMTPPVWYYDKTAVKFGVPSGPRLIVSGCQFVCHTAEIYDDSAISDNLDRLPFCWRKWEDPVVKEHLKDLGHPDGLNVQFDQTAFYMVALKVAGDYTQGFNFQPINLTNFLPSNPIDTGNGYTKTL